jgi:hypothetical protein
LCSPKKVSGPDDNLVKMGENHGTGYKGRFLYLKGPRFNSDNETMTKSYNLPNDGTFILIRAGTSYVLAGKPGTSFALCIEAPDEEVCQGLTEEDIIAVSAPEGGPLEPAVMLLELVRLYRTPLVVLPADHPGSGRLRYVVSAGDTIRLSCTIRRGTHPEQDILCGSRELSGMCLRGIPGGIEVMGLTGDISVSYLSYDFSLVHETAIPADQISPDPYLG